MRIAIVALACLLLAACPGLTPQIDLATGTTLHQRCVGYLILGRGLLRTAERRGWDSDLYLALEEAGRDYFEDGCGPLLGRPTPWPAPAVPPPDGPAVREPAADGDAGGAEAP